MLRSGTSGSITPLSAASPDAGASRQNSNGGTSRASSNDTGLPNKEEGTSYDSGSSQAPTSDSLQQVDRRLAMLPSFNRTASTASRSDGLLSVPATPAAEDMFRSPSQISVSSEADGYFTARPGSPVETGDSLSAAMLRTLSAKSRSALRRDRVSWSGRSCATASSNVDAELASTTSAALSIDDEACYVDEEVGSASYGKSRSKRIDFLSKLPPELSLYIIFCLEEHTDLLSASLVSKQWRALAMDQSVWRHLFFSHPGWAIREDAPLVLQHQAELRRIEAKAKRTAAREEAERLRRLQEQRQAASTSSPYLDRLAALKSWRETLHIPSFPHLAGLSLTGASHTEVDVDTGRPVASSSASAAAGPPMSPLRSPTAATGRFGLFLSPARPVPSTPAGARRAQEAAATSYFNHEPTSSLSRQASTASSIATGMETPRSRRHSADSNFAEVVEAEEFFAASLDWTRLYRDRYVLEQRWMRGHPSQSSQSMSRTNSAASTSESPLATASKMAKLFEPTKKFLRGHQDSVYCIRQDDGVGTGTAGKLVSGSRDRTIRVWDVETGACKHVLTGHTASVLSLQYDDQILVSVSSDGQVFVWDVAAVFATRPPSPSLEADEEEGGPIVHDKADRLHCVLRDHTSAVLDVVFDSNWIVTGSKDATVRVWRRSDVVPQSSSSSPDQMPSAPQVYRKFSHSGPVNAVDLQGGQVVSASGEGSMYLWDLESGEKVHKFSGHTKGLACIVFKGNTLVSGSNDQTIRVWDTKSGKCTHVLGEHHLLVRTVSYCPVRRLVVSGGYDRMIKLWHIDSDSPTPEAEGEGQREAQGEEAAEKSAALGRCLRDIKCHRARIFDVDFNTTRIVSASEDHLICITNFGGSGIDTSLFA